jgi:hypothetical protein
MWMRGVEDCLSSFEQKFQSRTRNVSSVDLDHIHYRQYAVLIALKQGIMAG